MWTYSFWKDTVERAVRAAAVILLTLWAGDEGFNVLNVDWKAAGGLALTGAAIQVLMCFAALPAGAKGTASFLTHASASPAAPKDTPAE
jgi:hypothetical protein